MVDSPERVVLVAKWWEYYRRAGGSRAEREALAQGLPPDVLMAHDHVAEIVDRGAPEAVELLADLAVATPADQSVTTVGAGPLEDLIVEHGDRFAREIAETARRVPAFAEALRAVSPEEA